MKKKQLFAGALAAAMMTASLAGCGGAASSAATSTTGGDTAGSTASADTNSGVVEVTIPSYKTGENAGAAFFVPQVERFNEKYAGKYKINLESVPQDSIFNDRLKQLAQQNKLPVLVEGGDPDWVKNVVIPNGLAYDLPLSFCPVSSCMRLHRIRCRPAWLLPASRADEKETRL